MTLNLIHRLKHRGYKQNQILKHIHNIKFNQRPESLTKRKRKEPKLIFTTNYCDDIRRIKCALKKHWKLIEQNEILREIFPEPPVITFKANPSLKHKLIRAKLKPLDDLPRSTLHHPKDRVEELPKHYPHTIFKTTLQNFRNPIKQCANRCLVCQILDTKCYAVSTTLNHKFPINFPKHKCHFNCQTTNVIYLITCETPGCRSQYVGYTTRQLKFRVYEHLAHNSSPMVRHCQESKHNIGQIKFQILSQAPDNTTDKETWLKRNEYLWICRLGTLNKLSKKA